MSGVSGMKYGTIRARKPAPMIHICNIPTPWFPEDEGNLFRCKCGKVYELVGDRRGKCCWYEKSVGAWLAAGGTI